MILYWREQIIKNITKVEYENSYTLADVIGIT